MRLGHEASTNPLGRCCIYFYYHEYPFSRLSFVQPPEDGAGKPSDARKAAITAGTSHVLESAQAGAQQLRDLAGEKASELGEFASNTWSVARDQAKDVAVHTMDYTRDNPIPAVAIAFELGLLIGLMCNVSELRSR